MTVYVDELRHYGYIKDKRLKSVSTDWCHMLPDPTLEPEEALKELHRLAASIGLRRSWFQDGSIKHYDLTPTKRRRAIIRGAKEITTVDYIKHRIKRNGNDKS